MCQFLLSLSDDELVKTAFTDEAYFSLGKFMVCMKQFMSVIALLGFSIFNIYFKQHK